MVSTSEIDGCYQKDVSFSGVVWLWNLIARRSWRAYTIGVGAEGGVRFPVGCYATLWFIKYVSHLRVEIGVLTEMLLRTAAENYVMLRWLWTLGCQ